MNQVVALAKGKHGVGHCGAHAEALARAGRLQVARLPSNRATDLALQEGQRGTAASYRAARAASGSRLRKCRRRKRSATEALESFPRSGGPIRRRSCPGFFRGIFLIRGARRRFGKALPGRCFCQIYLCAAFNDPESKGVGLNDVKPLIHKAVTHGFTS
jgi:hypothetical protein